MRYALVLGLLAAVAIAVRGQETNGVALSSNAVYSPLPRQARIQGEVTVLLSTDRPMTGHPFLIAGVKPDAEHWKEWAAMGMEQVTYVFEINPPIFVTTKVEVPRNKLVRLLPGVKKTRTEERSEQQLLLPKDGIRDIEITGKILRVTITVDTVILESQPSGVA